MVGKYHISFCFVYFWFRYINTYNFNPKTFSAPSSAADPSYTSRFFQNKSFLKSILVED